MLPIIGSYTMARLKPRHDASVMSISWRRCEKRSSLLSGFAICHRR